MKEQNKPEQNRKHQQKQRKEFKQVCKISKCLCHFDNFWNQLFAYQRDGNYTIDNSIAERNIRPLAGERKNSLFFGSHIMAQVSAYYHTLISTCRAQGYSALNYFKLFFSEIVKGRNEELLVMI